MHWFTASYQYFDLCQVLSKNPSLAHRARVKGIQPIYMIYMKYFKLHNGLWLHAVNPDTTWLNHFVTILSHEYSIDKATPLGYHVRAFHLETLHFSEIHTMRYIILRPTGQITIFPSLVPDI